MSSSERGDDTEMDRRYRAEVAAALATLGYSAVLNRLLPDVAHVPANVTAAGISTMVAKAAGVPLDDLGLAPGRFADGLQVGASVAGPTAAAIAIAAAAPATRRFFRDARVLGVERPAYEIGLRIPIGTALSEELIFRGALLGLFRMNHSTPVAIAMSSALFGIWHVLPTLESPQTEAALGAVLTAVAVTAAAGCALGWMRVRTGSIAAPVLVHAAVNVSAFAAVRFIGRRDRRAR